MLHAIELFAASVLRCFRARRILTPRACLAIFDILEAVFQTLVSVVILMVRVTAHKLIHLLLEDFPEI